MKASTLFNAYVSAQYRYQKLAVEMDEAPEMGVTDNEADEKRNERWQKLIRQQDTFRRAVKERIATQEALAGFGREVMEWMLRMDEWWGDETCNDYILPIAQKYGFAQMVKYDPEVHGDEIDAEPGWDIWWIDKSKWPGKPAKE